MIYFLMTYLAMNGHATLAIVMATIMSLLVSVSGSDGFPNGPIRGLAILIAFSVTTWISVAYLTWLSTLGLT